MSIASRQGHLLVVGLAAMGMFLIAAGLTANQLWPLPKPLAPVPEPCQSLGAVSPCCGLPEPQPDTDEGPVSPILTADKPGSSGTTATVSKEPGDDLPGFDPRLAGRLKPQAVDPPAPVAVPAASLEVKRRRDFSEDDLHRQLEWAPEIGIQASVLALLQAYTDSFQITATVSSRIDLSPNVLLRTVPEMTTLPVRQGDSCRLTLVAAANLQVLSQKLRIYLNAAAPPDAEGNRPVPNKLREAMKLEMRGQSPEWLRAEAIPTMMQLLMHEDAPVRLMLIDILAEIPGRAAAVALAQRAVFDLSPNVRASALRALRERPRADVRDVFLRGLRYPWSPAADHAAEALVAL
ncbi:MAG TPA: hypothetical protein VKD72_34375, partial [Gemmataceae bacterium]|nr:hypothetical protein [Gemmataceae bacterium]